MRLFIVDTMAAILFFTIVAAFNELFVAGMEPSQVLATRLIMVPVMVATGRPYGLWRDRLFRHFPPRRSFTRIGLDILAFLSFQMPVYVGTLVFAGATLTEIVVALGSAVVLMIALSRPYGLFLEWMRSGFGVSAVRP